MSGIFGRVKYPTAPRTLVLEKACQGDPSRAPTLLLLQISDLDHPWYWVWGRAGFRMRIRITVRVERVKYWFGPGFSP